jgi:hypothetical protein
VLLSVNVSPIWASAGSPISIKDRTGQLSCADEAAVGIFRMTTVGAL